jgi:hypothetical protein
VILENKLDSFNRMPRPRVVKLTWRANGLLLIGAIVGGSRLGLSLHIFEPNQFIYGIAGGDLSLIESCVWIAVLIIIFYGARRQKRIFSYGLITTAKVIELRNVGLNQHFVTVEYSVKDVRYKSNSSVLGEKVEVGRAILFVYLESRPDKGATYPSLFFQVPGI